MTCFIWEVFFLWNFFNTDLGQDNQLSLLSSSSTFAARLINSFLRQSGETKLETNIIGDPNCYGVYYATAPFQGDVFLSLRRKMPIKQIRRWHEHSLVKKLQSLVIPASWLISCLFPMNLSQKLFVILSQQSTCFPLCQAHIDLLLCCNSKHDLLGICGPGFDANRNSQHITHPVACFSRLGSSRNGYVLRETWGR